MSWGRCVWVGCDICDESLNTAGRTAKEAREEVAKGLCEEPTYRAPLVLVLTDLGREVARLLTEDSTDGR